jgi:hypothetical protein
MDLVPITDQVGSDIEKVVEIEFWNKDNKKSVYNLMPSRLRTIVERQGVRDLLSLEEWELKRKVSKISPTLNRLRYSFWNEYYRAVDSCKPMVQRNVFAGVCTAEAYNKFLSKDDCVAWIMCPPTDTVIALKETLNHGLDRIREILDLPLMRIESVKVGKDEFEDREVVDEKVANLMLKAVAMIDLRLHGSYVQVQKVEQTNTNINHNVTNNHPEPITVQNESDLDRELIELKSEVYDSAKKLRLNFNKDEIVEIQANNINPKEITSIPNNKLEQADVLETDVLDEL